MSKIVDFAFFCDFVLFDLIFSRVFVGGGTSSKRVGGHEIHGHELAIEMQISKEVKETSKYYTEKHFELESRINKKRLSPIFDYSL